MFSSDPTYEQLPSPAPQTRAAWRWDGLRLTTCGFMAAWPPISFFHLAQ